MNHPIKRLGGEEILIADDIHAFSKAQQAIIDYMQDGEWCSATSIIEVSGQREGLRRLRDLRGKGFDVERKRVSVSREFYYRLTPTEQPNPSQSTLF